MKDGYFKSDYKNRLKAKINVAERTDRIEHNYN